ncbi:MAG TPA: NAD(P)/FAD-dependent oxidoreductase [Fervidobacterium sp.]|nr:FAD/NAD(P)-binding oxidoreductase [Fervidobacterium sp.]HOK87651.1 NAD(P)/FAD-dependent oxidoreductase [Fervidobacterium sp.]HOM74089.1 NAD(P)/FAD-dependent oxidoreductase [Fervidobacterium sp.]HPP17742.1 NAD(P)/FAD-dependent oxidoreductase [Fervidobacterium sp.]HRD20432.1 NAD(P)/FAD-dependent oxidoreductase [Fervidobacterium sp.]
MIAVIGGGIVGGLIAREINKYIEDVYLFEAKNSIGTGITKGNSGIIHGGYDDPPGSLRAQLCYIGNQLYDEISRELSIEVRRIGSHVIALDESELAKINELEEKAAKNNVKEYRILERNDLFDMEPNLNADALMSFYCPIAGVTEPWKVAMQSVKSVELNGGKVLKNKKLVEVKRKDNKFELSFEDGSVYTADLVINAAGLYADEVARLFGDEVPAIFPVKGEYFLLGKDVKYVNSVIFPMPSELTKGCLVIPTVDGGYLAGPTAHEVKSKQDFSTTRDGLAEVKEKSLRLVPSLDFSRNVVKTFAGLRPESREKDFYIDIGKSSVIHVSGIRSPGLTAAPAIARYVVEYLIQEKLHINLEKRKDYISHVEKIPHFVDTDYGYWVRAIEQDPEAGEIVCFCNEVTKREIREAIRNGARTIDEVKFATRISFGECQGSFCVSKILKMICEETGLEPKDVLQNEKGSWIIDSEVRTI